MRRWVPATLIALVSICGSQCSLSTVRTSPAISTLEPKSAFIRVDVNAGQFTGHFINKNLIGVNGPGPVQAVGSMKRLGVHWVRTDVSLDASTNGEPNYNCATGSWNSTSLDQKVSQIYSEGGTPLEIIDYTPQCLSANPLQANWSRLPPDIGADKQKWIDLIREVAYQEIAKEGVRYFEVWNEPDWVFFNGGLSAYLQLYKDTSMTIEQVAEQERTRVYIGGPALADVLDTQDMTWLNALLSYVNLNKLPLDFISWHSYVNDPYSGPIVLGGPGLCFGRSNGPGTNLCYYNPNLNPDTIYNEVEQTSNALKAYPNLHPLLIVDEWNINGEYDPRQNQTYDAAYITSVLTSVNDSELAGMCFFSLADPLGSPAQDWGLLNEYDKPKPSYEAFDFWKQLEPDQIYSRVKSFVSSTLSATNTFAHGKVGVIASEGTGKNKSKNVSILLYNFKPFVVSGNYGTSLPTNYDRTVIVNLGGLDSGKYRITGHLEDGRYLNETVDSTVLNTRRGTLAVKLRLPGEAIELITIAQQD